MLLNPGYVIVIHLIQRFCHVQTDHQCAPLMHWYAIKMTYQGKVSTWGMYVVPFSLSPSLWLALSLSVVDGGDVKVDRWGWQPDNRLLSSASVTGFSFLTPMYPCAPSPLPPHVGLFSPYFRSHSFLTNTTTTSTIYTFPHMSPTPSISPHSPSLHSFTQCHNGPMLTEAFIKCQLYTRDHTVEGQNTMISDPKRSTCLWAFSSCWSTVCLLWGLSRL